MMKHAIYKNPIRRTAALALALLMLLGSLVSLAEPQPPLDPVSFTLTWTGDDGMAKTQQAVLVPYAEYPNSYWLYADADAVAKNAILHINDNFGQYLGGFSIPNDQPIGNLIRNDAGTAPAPENAVPMQAFDATGNVLMTYTLFVSAQTDQPQPPTVLPTPVPEEPQPIQDATVRIYYKNADGSQDVASMEERSFPAGTHAVNPQPADFNPAYDPNSVAPQQVTVDQNGANPAEIVFYYQPLPISDAMVRIYYKNADGSQDVASMEERSFPAGTHAVNPQPADLNPAYDPNSVAPQQVTVDQNGANPAEIVFYYQPLPIADATVRIYYKNADGSQDVASMEERSFPAGTHAVNPQPADLNPAYDPNSVAPQQVTVDQNGANPSEIVFYYQPLPISDATVRIYYKNADGSQDVASMEERSFPAGTHAVNPQPADLNPAYDPNSVAPQQVTVDQNGANPAEIVFYYQPLPISDATVRIYYKNADGSQDVASMEERSFPAGTHAVNPQPADLDPAYDPNSVAPQQVTVDQNGASPSEIVFYYQPLPIADATVRIYYKNADGSQDVASMEERSFPAGTHTVNPQPADLNPAYDPNSVAPQQVTVDQNGANPAEIVFYYQPLPISDATVRIYYKNADGSQDVASMEERSFPAGTHAVNPQPADLNPAYDPNSVAPQQVTVDQNGANPAEIVFYYQPLPISDATVRIYYKNADGSQDVASMEERSFPAGTHAVNPQPADLNPAYDPNSVTPQQVTVDQNGANPAEIVFYYQPLPIADATVRIYYKNADGSQDVASMEERSFPAGTHAVNPQPADLNPAYDPNSVTPQQVTVDQNGANPAEIVFYYQPLPIADATVRIYYKNADGSQDVASMEERSFPAGTHDVNPQPADLNPAYDPNSVTPQQVAVDQNGANPAEIVFYYQPLPISDATVRIYYKNADGSEDVASMEERSFPAGTHDVNPQPADLNPAYDPNSVTPQQVTVDQNGANPAEITFNYQLLPVAKADVRVHYLHENDDEPVAPDQVLTFEAGEHDITPNPEGLDDTYTLVSEPTVRVTVDANGATPAEVIFRYRQEVVPTEPVLAPDVEIDVLYLNREEQPVASPQKKIVKDGTNTVKAEPTDLQEGYFLPEGTDVQYVIVTMSGADPSVVKFYYEKGETPTEEPVETPPPSPKAAVVPVYYKDQFGNIIGNYNVNSVEGQPNTIHVDVNNLTVPNPTDYVLNDEAQKTVTVDAQGIATPAEVTFLFTNNNPPVSVDLPVHYRLESGEPVADSTKQTLTKVGPVDIQAQPQNLMEGYELSSAQVQQVTVNENGTATPNEVIFIYKAKAPTPAPEATEIPFEVKPLENVYGRPTSDRINFRSAPDSEANNTVATVTTNDVAHLLGEVVNNKNEVWYLAEINDTRAFIKQTVVKLMTEEEVYKHFGWTPAPPPPPTPKPEGMPLNLWAETNDKVRFRSSPDTKPSNNILIDLNKAEKLWVYAQEVIGEEELWYKGMARGKEGYVMAKFVDLYTQEQSDAYQGTLSSPAPTQSLPPTEKPVTTSEPPKVTEAPVTPAPATPQPVTQSPVPPIYVGYAVTTQQTALRTGADTKDESILATLPQETLVMALGQTHVSGITWHNVDVYGTGQSGFVPDSALRRINAQEADYYKRRLQPTATVAPPPTRVPDQVSGYAITLGDNVPMRNYVDPNAQISRVLPANTIVSVRGQEYAMGETWHLVQSGANYGFIRADQLRMLNNLESQAYIESLRQPTPTPMATLAPMTQNSLSSYGYVNADKVRLRKTPSTSAVTLKMMDKNAFALVLSSSQESDGVWYHINQGGTEGYIMGSYFTVLPINQLTQFLQSPAYQNANNVPTGTTTGGTPPRITPVEDFNAGVWKNPALAQASYEPFNPIATATPPVEAILMPSVSPSAGGFVVDDTSPTVDPLATFEPMGTDVPTKTTSRFPGGLLAVGIVAVLGGGGYYAYRMYQENQRRAAQRAAQRRQQAGQPGQQQPGAKTPYTRPAQPGQTPPGAQGTTAYRPPTQPGQTPPGAQGTTTYRPPTQPGQTPPTAQGTTTYRPPTQPGQTPPTAQGTTTYRPPTQPGQTPPGAQGTTAYRPPTKPGQTPPSAQGTTTYRPPTQPGQTPPSAQGTTTYRPPTQPGQTPPTAPGTTANTPPTTQPGQNAPQTGQSAPQQGQPQGPEETARKQAERRRRTDRHA